MAGSTKTNKTAADTDPIAELQADDSHEDSTVPEESSASKGGHVDEAVPPDESNDERPGGMLEF
jgi:hypothetical protein